MELTEEQRMAEESLWLHGDLKYLLRPDGQSRLYDFVRSHQPTGEEESSNVQPVVVECHRRLGKSYSGIDVCVEEVIRRPGLRAMYVAPTEKQCSSIVYPNMEKLMRACPSFLRPRKSGRDFIFENPIWKQRPEVYGEKPLPSVLKVVGADYRDGDLLRGAWSDVVYVDEAGLIKKLRYLVEDVILFQFAGRQRPLLVLVSTPPRSGDHEFTQYFVKRAIEAGKYMKITVNDNKDWTDRDQNMLIEAIGGGPGSIAWRREALCESLSDPNYLVTPEFVHCKDKTVVDSYPRPEHKVAYVGVDTGWHDFTAFVYAYLDFDNQKLVAVHAECLRYANTAEVAGRMRELEYELFPDANIRRFADAPAQQLDDFTRTHKLPMMAAEKYDKFLTIAKLRENLQRDRIRLIAGSTEPLQWDLEHAIMKENRRDFERTERGHFDCGMAFAYLNRMVNWRNNPRPFGSNAKSEDWFVRKRDGVDKSRPKVERLLKAFGKDKRPLKKKIFRGI